MPPAARITDPHVCPMVTGIVPHVGGPILPPGQPTVLIDFLPAATVTSMATCVGPPDSIVMGSTGVFINYLPAARLGDPTVHGGVIVMGSPTVIIGEVGPSAPGKAAAGAVSSGSTASGATAPTPAPPPATPPKVLQVAPLIRGTHGKRNNTNYLGDHAFPPTSNPSEDLSANKPVILVRGCHVIHLTATTGAPGDTVAWNVKPNQNKNTAPGITVDHTTKKAILQTWSPGSFSVIATSGSTKVVWNVVFVSVDVDTSTSHVVARKNYTDNSGGGATGFSSGQFAANQYTWEATVKVKLTGGGNDGKLGIDSIKLKTLQNGVADTLTGHYAGPPSNATAQEQPIGGLPIVDSNDASQPFVYFGNSAKVTPATGPHRTVFTGDSPGGGFPSTHAHTGKALQKITGINGFRTAVASVSDDAPNEIMVHADTHWQANFAGTVNAAGQYTAKGAHTSADKAYALIGSATGGQDACDAGFETFQPRFNQGTNTLWHP